jgi:hypothetical protein
VDFFLPGEKNSNIVTATHILISRIKVICWKHAFWKA